MRILYFSPAIFPERKSSSIQIVNTCHALARRGAQVELYVKKLKGTPAEVLAFYGLEPHPNLIIRLPGKKGSKRNAWSGRAFNMWITTKCLREGFNVRMRHETVCFYFRGASRVLGIIRRLARWAKLAHIPLIYEIHSIQYEDDVHLRRFIARRRNLNPESAQEFSPEDMEQFRRELFDLERNAYAELGGVITISDRLVELAAQHFGPAIAAKPHLVVPSGVPLEIKTLPPRAGRDVDLVYVGNLFYFNGVTVLLAALAQLPAQVRLAIIGGGSDEDIARCKTLTEQLNLSARVDFLGFLPHPEALAWLRRARVAVAPMLQGVLARAEDYCSPGKLGEYMASGATIVASRIPSLEVFLKDEKNSLLSQPNDATALAQTLTRALENESLSAQLAAQAFQDVQPYTFDSRANRIWNFLIEL